MDNPDTTNISWFQKWAAVIAVLILFGYGLFLYYLICQSSQPDEKIWTRLIFLFSGVEAIVFSAVGFLFGKEVHRARAESAEKDKEEAKRNETEAKKKEEEAKNNEQEIKAEFKVEKNKGENLAMLILNRVGKQDNTTEGVQAPQFSVGNEKNEILDLSKYVKDLYPTINNLEEKSSNHEAVYLSDDVERASVTFTVTGNIRRLWIDGKAQSKPSGTVEVTIVDGYFEVEVDCSGIPNWTFSTSKIATPNGNKKSDPVKSSKSSEWIKAY